MEQDWRSFCLVAERLLPGYFDANSSVAKSMPIAPYAAPRCAGAAFGLSMTFRLCGL